MVDKVFAEDAGVLSNGPECLANGNCTMEYNKVLGIHDKAEIETDTLNTFIKDAIGGATFFIGTLVTIALIASGLMLVFAGGNEKYADAGKKGIKGSIIGLLLVVFSYTIIRLVQYLAMAK